VPRFALGNSGDVLLYLGTYVSLTAGTTNGLKLHIFYHRDLLWAFLTLIIARMHFHCLNPSSYLLSTLLPSDSNGLCTETAKRKCCCKA
jgi:hypothetical protein